MNDTEKIDKIQIILKEVLQDFEPAILVEVKNKKGKSLGIAMKETKAYERKRLEKNFYVYALALENIYKLVNEK